MENQKHSYNAGLLPTVRVTCFVLAFLGAIALLGGWTSWLWIPTGVLLFCYIALMFTAFFMKQEKNEPVSWIALAFPVYLVWFFETHIEPDPIDNSAWLQKNESSLPIEQAKKYYSNPRKGMVKGTPVILAFNPDLDLGTMPNKDKMEHIQHEEFTSCWPLFLYSLWEWMKETYAAFVGAILVSWLLPKYFEDDKKESKGYNT
jgi:hypothetical protein